MSKSLPLREEIHPHRLHLTSPNLVHLPPPNPELAKRLRRRHAGTIWMAGVLMAVPLSVPLLNLLIPILGAATFTHLYHALVPHSDAASLRYPPR